MQVSVKGTTYKGTVPSPGSKSYTHRFLIAAALKKGRTTLASALNSDDTQRTIASLRSLGAKITEEGDTLTVEGINEPEEPVVIDAGESASTLRFLLPLVAALGIKARFILSDGLSKRPHKVLVDLLNEHGADIDSNYSINGRIESGVYEIDASISSEYITGLLFALSILDKESQIHLKNEVVSRPYLEMTEAVLKLAKVGFEKTDYGYKVYGTSTYSLPDSVVIEGDWSLASFMLVAGALSSEGVRVRGLNMDSRQPDSVVVDILKEMGAVVVVDRDEVFVKRGQSEYKPFDVDIRNMPDLALPLAVLALFSKGCSRMRGVERLAIKESDRLRAIIDMCSSSGAKAECRNGVLEIRGEELKPGVFDTKNDHRVVMASIILSGAIENGESTVLSGECVKKSYPNFYNDYKIINGEFICQNG